jgi:hypothetical protein
MTVCSVMKRANIGFSHRSTEDRIFVRFEYFLGHWKRACGRQVTVRYLKHTWAWRFQAFWRNCASHTVFVSYDMFMPCACRNLSSQLTYLCCVTGNKRKLSPDSGSESSSGANATTPQKKPRLFLHRGSEGGS